MDLRTSKRQNPPVTPVTNAETQQWRGFSPYDYRGQSGDRPVTSGDKTEQESSICHRCHQYFFIPVTAEARAVTGCHRCHRCHQSKQQDKHTEFAHRKLPKAAQRLACSLFSGVQKWRATLRRRAHEKPLQAAPLLGCSGLRCERVQFAQFAHSHHAQGWKPRRAWAAVEFAARARRPARAVKGDENARLRALIDEGAQPCASA